MEKRTNKDNVEEKVEDLLPKNTVKEVKKRPFVYLIASAVIIVLVIVLSVGLTLANKSLKEQRDIVSGLNLDLQKKENELTALTDNLSKTEEGRKQITQAKSQVEAKNKQLDTKDTNNNNTSSTSTPTPDPEPTIAKLDDQAKINFLTSYNKWNLINEFHYYQYPADNSYCYIDFTHAADDIHNNYDNFSVSDDFADIKQAQNNVYSKAQELASVKRSICNASGDVERDTLLTQFGLTMGEFNNLRDIYKQKIDYHS